MKKIIPILLFLFINSVSTAQQVVVEVDAMYPGTHATSSAAPSDAVPYNYNNRSVHLQLLYPANDLNSYGGIGQGFYIDSIGWYVVSQIGGNLSGYTIKMKNTSATNTQTYDGVGLSTVRSASTLLPAQDTGWYMIPLSTKFFWNGTSNLLIDVCWGVNSNNTATGTIRHYSAGGTAERILVKSNTSSTCSTSPTQIAAFRPYLRLTGACIDTTVARNGNLLVASNQSGATYQWIDCANSQPVSGANFPIFLPTASGNYKVIINNGICIDSSACLNYTLAGLNSLDNDLNVQAYPNPASSSIFLKGKSGKYEVSLYSITGQLLDKQNVRLINNDVAEIDLKKIEEEFVIVQIYEPLTASEIRKKIAIIRP